MTRPLSPAIDGGGGGSPPGYVCFAGFDWWYHSHAHADFQLMLRVARSRPVLFVNSIGMRVPLPGRTAMPARRVVRKARSIAKLLRRPVAGLADFHVMTPVSVPVSGSRGRARNAAVVRAQVRAAMRLLGMARAVCVASIPTAWDVLAPMDWERLVYNRYDKHSAFDEVDGEVMAGLERSLLSEADRVLYASRGLMGEEAPLVGERATFLDHGVDVDHFTKRRGALPDDLAAIAPPRLGYFGAFRDYSTDLDLIARVARELPDANVVLIGDPQCSLDRLLRLPNVHWLGPKPYAEIPSYGSGFDVGLLPLLCNGFTEYANPIKLKEYLALELPVVTTGLPECRPYDGLVRVATDAGDFVAKVHQTVADGGPSTPAARRAAVAGDTWDSKAELLVRLCEGRHAPIG